MSLIQQFTNSLWNFGSYRILARIRGGKSFLYIFILFTLIFGLFSIKMSVDANRYIELVKTVMQEDVPDFRLVDGRFSFDGEMPYRIEDDGFVLMIDTTGATQPEDLGYVMNGLLITETELVAISAGSMDITSFTSIPMNISRQQIIDFLPNLMVIVYIFLFIWYIFAFGAKLFGILMLTLIAMIANAIFNQKLAFGNLWNIAIYASTLPTLVWLLHALADRPLGGFFFFIYWGLAITYAFLGVYHISRGTGMLENQELADV